MANPTCCSVWNCHTPSNASQCLHTTRLPPGTNHTRLLDDQRSFLRAARNELTWSRRKQHHHLHIYMDDRSFITPSIEQCTARVELWNQWSQQVQLRENLQKIQAVAKTKKMQQRLTEDQPQWTQHSSVKVLGVTITTKNTQNSEVETQRIQKSIARTKLLTCLPLPRPKIQDMYQALVVPVAAYGWTCRKAPAETAKVLRNTLTKALNATKMANTEIRKVVYAATTHLDIITLQSSLSTQLSATLAPKGAMAQSCIHFHSLTSKTHERSWMAGNWPLELDGSTLQGNHQVGGHDRLTKLEIFLPSTSHTLEAALFVQLGQRTSSRSRSLEANSNCTAGGARAFHVRATAYTATAAQRAVLLGSVVSPTWLHRSMGTSPCSCTWATLEHIYWHCPFYSALDGRPKIKEQK